MEVAILRQYRQEIAARLSGTGTLIEYGSGSSAKVRILLEVLPDLASYVPVDISRQHLLAAAGALAADYPNLQVIAVCDDYTRPLRLPVDQRAGRRAIFFPGSSIGNLEPEEAQALLHSALGFLRQGDGFLVGVDLKKAPATLHAAYNDAQGVTAAFNLNVLRRLNDELGTDFALTNFAHLAFYNADDGRIEMHLRSLSAQTVHIDGESIHFRPGETIHTENSHKYSVPEFQELALVAGLVPRQCWTDPEGLFSLHCLQVP